MACIQDSLFGKTYSELSALMNDATFELCLKKSDKPIFQYLEVVDGQEPEWLEVKSVKLHGEHSTLNFGEFHSIAKESSLLQVLEKNGGDLQSIT